MGRCLEQLPADLRPPLVNWAVEAGREALNASPDWSLVLVRMALLVGLAALTTAWATRTFQAYQRSI